MVIGNESKVKNEKVELTGVKSVSIKWLIGKEAKAPNFYLRQFEIEPGGHTPLHTHKWEHEVFVIEGEGQINTKDKSRPVIKGSFALIQPDEPHQFENTGRNIFRFLCIIPV